MTRTPAHTPGPWHKSSTHSGAAFDIGAANGANVALVSGPAENGADEFETNADLFVAAPALLAALKLVREFNCKHAPALMHLPLFKSMDAAVFAAIAAAKGGA